MDVFSVLPMPEEGASGPGRVQGGDWRPETPATSADGYKPSPVSLKQYKAEDREPSPQEMAYRSVRKARIPARSTSPKDEQQWKAAKAVME